MHIQYKLMILFFALTLAGFGQFPTGGYQGGGFGSGGDQTLDVAVVDLKVFMQGCFMNDTMTTTLNRLGYLPLEQPYDTNIMWLYEYGGDETVAAIPHDSVTDWILVELRETVGGPGDADRDSIIAQRAGFILSNGKVTDLDGVSELRFKYTKVAKNIYPVIIHRNHLPVMPSNALTEDNEVYSYDFSDAQSKAYQSPLYTNPAMASLDGGVYGMWTGEVATNNVVNYDNISNPGVEDRTELLNQLGGLAIVLTGYHKGDLNLDGVARYAGKESDRLMIWKNTENSGSYIDIFGHIPF